MPDFSRFTFNPAKNYNKVYVQQGACRLDSDWNALVDMLDHRMRVQMRDLIGPWGGPTDHCGFGVHVREGLLLRGMEDFFVVSEHEDFSFHKDVSFSIQAFAARHPFDETVFADQERILVSRLAFDDIGRPLPGSFIMGVDPFGCPFFKRVERIEEEVAVTVTVRSSVALDYYNLSNITLTYDGAMYMLFIDGAAAAQVHRPFLGEAVRAPLTLGGIHAQHDLGESFVGMIEEIRIWRRALSQGEAGRREVERSEIIARWRFTLDEKGLWDSGQERHHASPFQEGQERATVPPGLFVSRGIYYVDGIRCMLQHDQQVQVPGDLNTPFLVYLEAKETVVTQLEDKELAEPAACSMDVSVRTRIDQHVGILPVLTADQAESEWLRLQSRATNLGMLAFRHNGISQAPGNRLFRLELHGSGRAYGSPLGDEPRVSISFVEENLLYLENLLPDLRVFQLIEIIFEEDVRGKLTLVTEMGDGWIKISEPLDFDAVGMQIRMIAGFKWGHDNARRQWRISALETVSQGADLFRARITLDDPNAQCTMLKPGAMLELFQKDGTAAGMMLRVEMMETPETLIVTSVVALDDLLAIGALVQLWDHAQLPGFDPRLGLMPVTTDHWPALDYGIEVRFRADDHYVSGWIWYLATRETVDGYLLWPGIEETGVFQRPHGGIPAIAPLALIDVVDDQLSLSDLRATFAPLTNLTADVTEDSPVADAQESSELGAMVLQQLEEVRQLAQSAQDAPAPVAGLAAEAEEALIARIREELGYLEDQNPSLGDDLSQQEIKQQVQEIDDLEQVAETAPAPIAHLAREAEEALIARLREELSYPGEAAPIPEGFMLLGIGDEAPPGFQRTGLHVRPSPWSSAVPLPEVGPIQLAGQVGWEGGLYIFLMSGELWRYNIQDRAWEELPPMPPCSNFGVCAIDNRIHVMGGRDENGAILDRHLVFSIDKQTWFEATPMRKKRAGLSVAVHDGHIYAVGGEELALGLRKALDTLEIYRPSQNAWRNGPAMHHTRSLAGIAVLEGRIHVVGGRRYPLIGRGETSSHEVFDPSAEQWTEEIDIPVPCYSLGAAAYEGNLVIAGGLRGDSRAEVLKHVDRLPAGGRQWREGAALPAGLGRLSLCTAGGRLFAVGAQTRRGDELVIYERTDIQSLNVFSRI